MIQQVAALSIVGGALPSAGTHCELHLTTTYTDSRSHASVRCEFYGLFLL
jgi:hypothetical protein